jgi:DNA-binding LacI/PurR family transcriptional regulator
MATQAPTPTLEMVAALAGVSRSTVSRVVNSSPSVAPAVLAAVNAAIEQLGYVPNRAARSLASHRTRAIALVIPEDTAKFFADPYYAAVVPGVAQYLSTTDYTLTLLIASERDEDKTRRYLLSGNVDGALILSHHTKDRLYVQLAHSLPVVFGGRPTGIDAPDIHVVDIDNVAAASMATRVLLDHGRRRLATIAGPQNIASAIDRVTGWRETLASASLPDDLVEVADWSTSAGADAMRRLLARDTTIDGLFAASAQIAFGALGVLHERGIDVPGQIAIATIDNDQYAQSSNPALTTVEQPTAMHGSTIAATLLRLIDGEEIDHLTLMPTTLIERGSV